MKKIKISSRPRTPIDLDELARLLLERERKRRREAAAAKRAERGEA